MNAKTKKLTLAAMLAALQLVLLYIGTLLPSWKLASVAVAGVITAAVLIECGPVSSVLAYVVVGVLGLVLLPQKALGFLYLVFFGYYPLIKSLAEHVQSRVLEWIAKLAVFNVACTICFAAVRFGFVADVALPDAAIWLLWIGLNGVFLVFDFGLSKLIALYLQRIHYKIKR